MIDLRLFTMPAFGASLATYGLSILVLFGGFLFLPQYLQLVRGLTPFQAGLWTLPWAASFVAGSLLTPPVAKRVRPATLMSLGLVFAAFGFALFTRIDGTTAFGTFALGSTIFSLGMAPVFTLTTDLVVGSAPPKRAGAASAISETSAELGGALGIALFGSIGIAVYRRVLALAVPESIPAEIAETARATLGGALAAAGELPHVLSSRLTDAAQLAFLQGIWLCAWISTFGSIALAAFVWFALGRAREKIE